jgi:hypothetical protein
MAVSGEYQIRGLDIDKISKDYLDEALIFKPLVTTTKTSAREIRWYQKTSGFLTQSASLAIGGVAEGARPFVLEQSWTRQTSFVKKYFQESPWITIEDETDSDIQVFMKNAEDLAQAVAYDLDKDIWNVISENRTPVNINSTTSTAAWDAGSGQDPFKDLADAVMKIRKATKRKLRDGALLISAKGEKDLLVWLVSTKGASIPSFASGRVEDGNLTRLAGLRVVVSENVTADYAMVGDLGQACEYKEFIPMTTSIIEEKGIGKKVRCWTHGVALLVKPKFITLISNTEA